MTSIKLAWGESPTGRMKHISEVPSGKACDCICPDCRTPLIAHKGRQRRIHFIHSATVDCAGESALHRAAKQVLIDAAVRNEPLTLPGIKGTISGVDLAGVPHSATWELEAHQYLANSGEQEVRLREDLITDVLLSVLETATQLAVEIHVTNKKNECDLAKYLALKHDAIEIDLSTLGWDTGIELLREKALRTAPRHWLYSGSALLLEQDARARLEERVQGINEIYREEVTRIIEPLKTANDLSGLRFSWPRLSTSRSRKNAFGDITHGVAKASPKITALGRDWEALPGGWRVSGTAGKKAAVDVLFMLKKIKIQGVALDRPSLLLEIDTASFPPEIEATWLGHAKWIKALEQRAEQDLCVKLEGEAARKGKYDHFASQFRTASNRERLDMLAKRLGVPAPESVGGHAPAWNAPWAVWKTLVWLYHIQKQPGGWTGIKVISENRWLGQLLGWSEEEDVIATRAKNLWFWFKDLERAGILEHAGRQLFQVAKVLPRNFVPWERL